MIGPLAALLLALPVAAAAPLRFDPPFEFGLATAPGQSEDSLPDIWAEWGRAGKVAGFQQTPQAERRLDFWSHPEVEIDLAARAGVQVLRLGVDWGRVMPAPHRFDEAALARYRTILKMIRARRMKVMLTLMHHSVPRWAQDRGGWLNDAMKSDFAEFSRRVIDEYHGEVDTWVTFNEANVFAPLAYSAGLWPPGDRRASWSLVGLGPLRGETVQAMDRMSDAHNELYAWAHAKYPTIRMGIAQNMAHYTGKTWFRRLQARYPDALMNWRFPERIRGRMDFLGMNYYGAEWVKNGHLDIDPAEEYSESGRAVDPQGLLLILREGARRFPGLPILLTENGVSDSTDLLRPAYFLEHLAAVAQARAEGVPVGAYFLWTLSDNLEWADGYCPKFGLVTVDRAHGLRRVPRPSFALFKTVVSSREVTPDQRARAWSAYAAHAGENRPFCRFADGMTPLGEPVTRRFSAKDWRFVAP